MKKTVGEIIRSIGWQFRYVWRLRGYSKEGKIRIREFLEQDVQFDTSWARLLIAQSQVASKQQNYSWEGAANANAVVINHSGVRIEPLHDQYSGDLFLSHGTFVMLLEKRISGLKRGGEDRPPS
ncbi:hypothetical protein [Kiloniella laminariae]|uniref:hypothetical protein n=1 Tax=Kiloniella laminariae TaxID=454162 RepID=UPI00036D6F4B|nr:hypothetical protein [Kiloniella laminariae]